MKGLVRPLRSIVHDALDTVFEYDSRIWRTLLPLYLLPGRITLDYLEGKRIRFVLPFRLFFVMTVISFLALQLSLTTQPLETPADRLAQALMLEDLERERLRRMEALEQRQAELEAQQASPRALAAVDLARGNLHIVADEHAEWFRLRDEALAQGLEAPPRPGGRRIQLGESGLWDRDRNPVTISARPAAPNERLNDWVGRALRNIDSADEDWSRLSRRFFSLLPPVLFVLVPMFALLLKALYLRSGRLYMEHLVVALHTHSFVGMATLVALGLYGLRAALPEAGMLQGAAGFLAKLSVLWIPVHLLLLQRHVYAQGWIWSTLKFSILGVSYVSILAVATTVAVAVSLVTA
ncbi:MAG: DUF3667 domain-containing protein [Pseudomonadales bacterium]